MPAKTKTAKSAKKPARAATKKSAKTTQEATCAATTTRGTACALKARPGAAYCARHADQAATLPKSDPAASGKGAGPKTRSRAPRTSSPLDGDASTAAKRPAAPGARTPRSKSIPAEALPEARPGRRAAASDPAATVDAEASAAEAVTPPPTTDSRDGAPSKRRFRPKPPAQRTLPSTDVPVDAPPAADETKEDAFVDYASSYSGMLEASPYEDQITTEMAIGAEEVDDDERPDSASGPRLSEEDARVKAIDAIGPPPDIIPEEDVHDELGAYERRLQAEIRRLMGGGGGRRRRGRRGGRRRRGEGGGGGGGGGPDRPAQGDGRGRRRGGRGRGRRPDRRGPGGGGGGAAPNVARDSPLANNRPSRGPKRGVQPRRRREPDF